MGLRPLSLVGRLSSSQSAPDQRIVHCTGGVCIAGGPLWVITQTPSCLAVIVDGVYLVVGKVELLKAGKTQELQTQHFQLVIA